MESEITLSTATMTGVLGFLILLLVVLLWRVFSSEENTLSCWQFIGTKAKDGKHYADLDKLGKVVGIFVSSWVVIKLAYVADAKDYIAFALLLGTYLAFVGGIAGYAAYLRTKEGNKVERHTETTATVTEFTDP